MEWGDKASEAQIAGATHTADYAMPTEFPVTAVIISQQRDTFILFIEHASLVKNPNAYFLITRKGKAEDESRCPKIRDIVEIQAAEPIAVKNEEVPPEIEPRRLVTKYKILNEPQEATFSETVACHEIAPHFVTVVGLSFKDTPYPLFTFGEANKMFSPSCFLMVDPLLLPSTVLETIEHPVDGTKYFVYRKDFHGVNLDEEGNPKKVYYPDRVRNLTTEEIDWVFTRLKSKKSVKNLSDCELYIQQPHIAAYLAEHFRQDDQCRMAEVITRAVHIKPLPNGGVELGFDLNEALSEAVIFSNIDHQWRSGVELLVEHNDLKFGSKMVPVFGTIINVVPYGSFCHSVKVVSQERSKRLARMILDNPKGFKIKPFRLCPQRPNWYNVVTAIETHFSSFVLDRQEMFKMFTGRIKAPPRAEIPDKDEPFYVKGQPLDPHQQDFVQCAAANRGWTVGQAPPGCGKTHSLSGLVAKLVMKGAKGGICLVSPTNAAVNNGADMIQANFPGIKIVRHFSLSAEQDATEETKRMGLKQLARNSCQLTGEHVEKHQELLKAALSAEQGFEHERGRTKDQLRKYEFLQKQEKKLEQYYLGKYDMHIYAATVEILLREGDVFARDSATAEEYNEKSIKWLILDEAGQLSPVDALALYCLLPNLTHICLLGDSYQLGPHSRLKENTMIYNFLSRGELTRMYALKSTHKKDLLRIYRCHPKIARQILFPIYGDKMECGTTEEDRSMAKTKNLIVAEDGSPVVFVDIKGREEGGRNIREVTILMELLYDLVEKGIESTDVQILCFHRHQMDAVKTKMEKIRIYGADGRYFKVTTVDSFQGKEAKIIILLTTKTSPEQQGSKSKLQFIAAPQRATVAVSRAQHMMYVLGDCEALATTEFYARLLPYAGIYGGFVNENLKHDNFLKDRCLAHYPKESKKEADRVSKEHFAQLMLEYENRLAREQEEAARAALLNMQVKDEEEEVQELGKESQVEETMAEEEQVVTQQEEKLSPEEEEEIKKFQEALHADDPVNLPITKADAETENVTKLIDI